MDNRKWTPMNINIIILLVFIKDFPYTHSSFLFPNFWFKYFGH